ncbi:hypothetical protein PF004_g31360 [Phytophthora fragariae]|uniref:RxLR effector protein n=1 Tax=Phytophthora fragariae TaxID=53985 RepID=A0A6G0MAZ8_9STRA|nr:hypothetical protein PF004_g31360 [Phytophthora fragariae]
MLLIAAASLTLSKTHGSTSWTGGSACTWVVALHSVRRRNARMRNRGQAFHTALGCRRH